MATAPLNNLLINYPNMEPVAGTMKYRDPNTGKLIKITVCEPETKRRSWSNWIRKITRRSQAGERDYQSRINGPRNVTQLEQAGMHSRYHAHPGEEDVTLDDNLDFPPYNYYPNFETGPEDYRDQPPPSDGSGNPEEDSFYEETQELYLKLQRKSSNGYANVAVDDEPKYSTVGRRAPPLTPRAPFPLPIPDESTMEDERQAQD